MCQQPSACASATFARNGWFYSRMSVCTEINVGNVANVVVLHDDDDVYGDDGNTASIIDVHQQGFIYIFAFTN